MNVIDIILGLLLLYGLIMGFFRGFLAEVASFIGVFIGFFAAFKFYNILALKIEPYINLSLHTLQLISFFLILLFILALVSWVGKLLTQIANFAALGIVNKLLGAGFGFLKMAFITSILLLLFTYTNKKFNILEDKKIENSRLYKPIAVIAPTFLPVLLEKSGLEELFEIHIEEDYLHK